MPILSKKLKAKNKAGTVYTYNLFSSKITSVASKYLHVSTDVGTGYCPLISGSGSGINTIIDGTQYHAINAIEIECHTTSWSEPYEDYVQHLTVKKWCSDWKGYFKLSNTLSFPLYICYYDSDGYERYLTIPKNSIQSSSSQIKFYDSFSTSIKGIFEVRKSVTSSDPERYNSYAYFAPNINDGANILYSPLKFNYS